MNLAKQNILSLAAAAMAFTIGSGAAMAANPKITVTVNNDSGSPITVDPKSNAILGVISPDFKDVDAMSSAVHTVTSKYDDFVSGNFRYKTATGETCGWFIHRGTDLARLYPDSSTRSNVWANPTIEPEPSNNPALCEAMIEPDRIGMDNYNTGQHVSLSGDFNVTLQINWRGGVDDCKHVAAPVAPLKP